MGCVKEQPQNEFGPVPARTDPADALYRRENQSKLLKIVFSIAENGATKISDKKY